MCVHCYVSSAEAIAGVVSGILIGAVVATVMIILAVIFLWRWRNSKRIIGEIRAVNGIQSCVYE